MTINMFLRGEKYKTKIKTLATILYVCVCLEVWMDEEARGERKGGGAWDTNYNKHDATSGIIYIHIHIDDYLPYSG